MDDLPLLELFTRLREAGLPLGIPDYEAAVQALQKGYGLPDRAALARLCQTLWVRSPDEQRLFDHYFEQLIGAVEESPAASINEARAAKTAETTKPIRDRELRNVIWRMLGVAAFGVAAFIVSDLTLPPDNPAKIFKPAPTVSPSQSPVPTPTAGTPTPIASPTSTPQSSNARNSTNRWNSVLVIAALAISSILLFLLAIQLDRILKRRKQERLSASESKLPTPEPGTKLASNLLREAVDAVQIAQAVQQITNQRTNRSHDRFLLATDYLPVTQRQMKQSWRHLRRMVREGDATELDVEATVQRIAHDGMLLNPVLVARRTNRTELVLLMDQDGSMVPFHSLSARLVETALRGGRLGKAGAYYFHNCPVEYLYNDPMHQEAEPIEEVLRGFQRDRTAVLIFSDAGAARGGLNLERAELTATFLQQLKQQVRYVAWLNPMPKPRWNTSTAREIALHVPMFEATRQGLDEAIDALRGRHHTLAALLGGQK